MEKILILITEIGGACGVAFGVFFYLFKSTFSQMIEPLSKSIDRLSFNVEAQTTAIREQKQKLETLETRVDGHETRLTVIEHDHNKGEQWKY